MDEENVRAVEAGDKRKKNVSRQEGRREGKIRIHKEKLGRGERGRTAREDNMMSLKGAMKRRREERKEG